ncbi:hypothetical protein G2W53_042976 [Senna tora]|uniref:Uncharacterized protein n=1 Tax=Senna tora TaxID=362788 RepID=A0A834SJU1_9FABA|nr:hypothetical protein G2W53_042976 [Senna tora]
MHTMGNCVAFQLALLRKQTRRGPLIEEAETESSAVVQNMINNVNGPPCKRYILVRRKLQNEEINHLAPLLLTHSVKPKVHYCTTTERRKVKIVVTLEQWELLLRGEKKKKIQFKNGIVCFKQSFRFLPARTLESSLFLYGKTHKTIEDIINLNADEKTEHLSSFSLAAASLFIFFHSTSMAFKEDPTEDALGCDVDLFLSPPPVARKPKMLDFSVFGDPGIALELIVLLGKFFMPSSSVFSLSFSLS